MNIICDVVFEEIITKIKRLKINDMVVLEYRNVKNEWNKNKKNIRSMENSLLSKPKVINGYFMRSRLNNKKILIKALEDQE